MNVNDRRPGRTLVRTALLMLLLAAAYFALCRPGKPLPPELTGPPILMP